jgi:V/A-type H+-transporting ATPase subunit I
MGALSILVHAVRLNTLEFSGAKGVSWSGRPFKPFKSTLAEPVTAVESSL